MFYLPTRVPYVVEELAQVETPADHRRFVLSLLVVTILPSRQSRSSAGPSAGLLTAMKRHADDARADRVSEPFWTSKPRQDRLPGVCWSAHVLTSRNPSTGKCWVTSPSLRLRTSPTRSPCTAAQPHGVPLAPQSGLHGSAGRRNLVAAVDTLGPLLSREMGKPLREPQERCAAAAPWPANSKIVEALEPTRQKTVVASTMPRSSVLLGDHAVELPAVHAALAGHPCPRGSNTVVLKPSEETPLIAAAYVQRLQRHLPRRPPGGHGDGEQGGAGQLGCGPHRVHGLRHRTGHPRSRGP